jgi:glyoxylase-like metal-dependent hydrolase (beta-lactamase superfamily II)
MTIVYKDSALVVEHVIVGPLDNNVFTLTCTSTGEGVLIDAADEDVQLLELSKRTGVRRVITTHGHFDHIGAVVGLRNAGIDVGIHESDATMLPSYDYLLNDEDMISVGELKLKLIHTPGHTPGSISIRVDETPLLFTGDTLFPGGPGATHFPGGDFATIMKSIEEKLMILPSDTVVLPGHGRFTTIGDERPSIAEWAARGW